VFVFVNFSPKEPPAPEPEWSEQETDVVHLNQDNFKTITKKKKAALVFFYAPCKTNEKRKLYSIEKKTIYIN